MKLLYNCVSYQAKAYSRVFTEIYAVINAPKAKLRQHWACPMQSDTAVCCEHFALVGVQVSGSS